MLKSTIVSHSRPIVEYIIYGKDITLEEYVSTAKKLYEHILRKSRNTVFAGDLIVIILYTSFINHLISLQQSYPELYQWVDMEGCLDLLGRLDEEKTAIMLVEAKECFQERAWSKYGMLLFIKFMMGNSGALSYPVSEKYQNFTQKEQHDYIRKNYSSIEPFVVQKGKVYFNAIYFDMLNAFLNNINGIQKAYTEYDIQLRFAKDAYSIVDYAFKRDDTARQQVKQMIDGYIAHIQKI